MFPRTSFQRLRNCFGCIVRKKWCKKQGVGSRTKEQLHIVCPKMMATLAHHLWTYDSRTKEQLQIILYQEYTVC